MDLKNFEKFKKKVVDSVKTIFLNLFVLGNTKLYKK